MPVFGFDLLQSMNRIHVHAEFCLCAADAEVVIGDSEIFGQYDINNLSILRRKLFSGFLPLLQDQPHIIGKKLIRLNKLRHPPLYLCPRPFYINICVGNSKVH